VPEERHCNVDGVPVRYRVAGAGPAVVLVHGLAGSWRWWKPVVEPLSRRLRVYLVDLPGFGTARGRRFVLADAPSYVHAFIDEIGLERPHLVGHSLGGAVSARVAAVWPESVDRLVLGAPAGLLERRHPGHYALPLAAVVRHARPRFLGLLVRDSLTAGLATLYRAGTQLLGDDALRGQLGAITAPTLLVWGERDRVVPLQVAAEYERAIPDARLLVLEGAGHVPMVERPLAFARAVLDFVTEPAPSSSGADETVAAGP
jgi:pimeloyl-ACP methyl ester carboxylesterase